MGAQRGWHEYSQCALASGFEIANECPIPSDVPNHPRKPASRSGRLRQRFRGKLQIWRQASAQVVFINILHSGSHHAHERPRCHPLSSTARMSQTLALEKIWGSASSFVRDRRGFLSGGHRASPSMSQDRFHVDLRSLVKNIKCNAGEYARKVGGPVQVLFCQQELSSRVMMPVLNLWTPCRRVKVHTTQMKAMSSAGKESLMHNLMRFIRSLPFSVVSL